MSFAEFQKKRDAERDWSQEAIIHSLRDIANDVDLADNFENREDYLHEFLTEMLPIIEQYDPYFSMPEPLLKTICEIADNFIDDMDEKRGVIHLFLRNIKQLQNLDVTYAVPMQENLSSRFSSIGLMGLSVSQFLSFERNGQMSLNKWGEFVLDRMEDDLVLAACTMDEDNGVSQIYTVQDMIVRGL